MIDTQLRPRFGPVTLHGPRRRRRRLTVAAMLVLATATVVIARYVLSDAHRDYLATDGWPAVGQGAYQLGAQTPAVSPHEQPAPIASLAKVMTAYLVLQHEPLDGDADDGTTLTVVSADVADYDRRRAGDESVVRVRAGERLTERQALMALLLPSANNIAVLLARQVSGSVDAFVAEMNRAARALGMSDTTYTDPSGFDEATVSTAIDQLRLARAAAGDTTLSAMMATRSYRLPVAGTVDNTDGLLGSSGFVGMKTGSDDAAGGCFMFHARRTVNGRTVDLFGVVLGQQGHNLIDAGLYAARQLADRVAPTD